MKKRAKRMKQSVRRELILATGLELATKYGIYTLTRGKIAAEVGVSPGLVSFYYDTMRKLTDEIMREAIARGVHAVVAQGLVNNCPIALSAPREVKLRAALLIAM